MRIPDIANRLREIAGEIEASHAEKAEEIRILSEEMRRRPYRTRAPRSSTSMTPELKSEIREYAAAHPEMSHQSIAELFNVNHGRVSEAVNGKRE